MFNSVVLDVAIGLVFIYLLYSLLATIIQEIIATKLAFRSKILEKAIIRMLEDGKATNDTKKYKDRVKALWHLIFKFNELKDKEVAAWFYAHPLIKYLGEDNFYSKPAYLSAQNFSKVIIDLLKGFNNSTTNDTQQINDSVMQGTIFHLPIDLENDKKNPAIAAIRAQLKDISKGSYVVNPANTVNINADTTLFLQSLWRDANADVDIFRKKLENWFDDTMQRASGWYKRYVNYILFIVGFIIAIGFNVDSISITKKLMQDPKLREQMVQNASNYLENNKQLGRQLDEMKYRRIDTGAYYRALSADYNLQRGHIDTLYNQAQILVDSNINGVNKLMGLGWPNGFLHFGAEQDQACINKIGTGQDWTCIIGWLITALAISLGAPFWFDMLNKLMKLRGTGDKESSDSAPASTNLQAPPAPVTVNLNPQTGGEAVG